MNDGVDYMWSSQMDIASVLQVSKLSGKVPDREYPSDHLSLQAVYNV